MAGWDRRKGGQVSPHRRGGKSPPRLSCLSHQVFATLNGLLARQPFAVGGSGSSYVYGFVDAEFRRGMSKQEAQQLVVHSELVPTE